MANERLGYRVSAFPVTVFAHLLVVSIVTLVLYWLLRLREGIAFRSDIKFKIFNLHILFTVLGFILFSGEVPVVTSNCFEAAILTYKTIPATRYVLKITHLVLHLIALFAGIMGVYAVFKFHDEINVPHMYTLHSWIGLSTICLFGLQLLLGFVTFLFPGAAPATRARFAPWHVLAGVVIFLMLIVTAETGLMEKFIFQKLETGHEAHLVNFIGLLILLFGLSVGLSVVIPLKGK